jgi:hypothetical protein
MSKCGPQTQLVSNDHVRISQCACGTYHVNFAKRGLSLQMGAAEARALGEAMGIVVRVADAESRGREIPARDPN